MAGTTEHTPKTPLGGVKAFSCRNCGGQVELRAPGQTMTAVCQHCSSIVDITDENFRILQRYNMKMDHKPRIPLGRRGVVEGTTWEVVGYLYRQAVGYDFYWEEYLLFNPRQGFRWLLYQYGNWSFTKPMVEFPERTSATFQFRGDSYRRYSTGKAKVLFVLGEFYWQVKRNEEVQTADWVREGSILSLEVDEFGLNWTESTFLERKEVKKAFGEDVRTPPPRSVAPHQVNPYARQLKSILPIFLIALLAVFGYQVTVSSQYKDEVTVMFTGETSESGVQQVTESFEITGRTNNVQLDLYTPDISNSWFEVEGYLHHLETNTNRDFRLTNEYYYGVTDGESWTEGSKRTDMVINNVPPGKYELVFTPYFAPESINDATKKQNYQLYLLRGVPIASNMWIILVIILSPVIYLWFRSSNFKKAQWADAD